MKASLRVANAASVLAIAATLPASVLAGVIEWRVIDQSEAVLLEGAFVRIDETGAFAATNRAGEHRLSGVPAGCCTLAITYVAQMR